MLYIIIQGLPFVHSPYLVADMYSDLLKELEASRASVARLEAAIATELSAELAALPGRFGFDSADAFIAAVRSAAGVRRGRKRRAAAPQSSGTKRKRAVVTDSTRASVKKMVEAGKTGNEIATNLGISLPTVQNIKKALGLVRKR